MKNKRSLWLFASIGLLLPQEVFSQDSSSVADAGGIGLQSAKEARLTWTEPGVSSADSVPLGNGDIGMNVWQEADGSISFYISKTDTWDDSAQLIKVGKLRLECSPNPFQGETAFEFRPDEGCVEIRAPQTGVVARIRVDANHPLVVVDIDSPEPLDAELALSPWRPEVQEAGPSESESRKLIMPPSVEIAPVEGGFAWYQRNKRSVWQRTLELQGLGDFATKNEDPLLHRTFGAMASGDGAIKASPSSLRTEHPRKHIRFLVSVLTQTTSAPEEWIQALAEQHGKLVTLEPSLLWKEHLAWWQDFWNRSWVRLEGFPEALSITQAYVWQRFMLACAGRGAFPIKFNGSIFTADWEIPKSKRQEPVNADYRRWGGAYWFQNTRLMYWAMLGAGDYDEMQPLFRLYRNMLPLAEWRSRSWYGHDGANFFETLHFFGALRESDYGTKREGLTVDEVRNSHIARYWSSGLELSLMMLDTYERTGDRKFLHETVLPVARAVLLFYDKHYPTEDGHLVIEPSQALEQFHNVRNPSSVIAGLTAVLGRLLSLDPEFLTPEDRSAWLAMQQKVPPLPMEGTEGNTRLQPAEKLIDPKPRNGENPEIYAIFPYQLFGVGHPELELARRTFIDRKFPRTGGWRQVAIQAACLGLADEAAQDVLRNASSSFKGARFPGFWGPNNDWIPDMCHGSVTMIALQKMLCQSTADTLFLLPAWPEEWNVSFRLPFGDGSWVEGAFLNGNLSYQVTPKSEPWKVQLMSP